MSQNFRKIVLGEHILENNPDCQMNKFGDLCNPPIIQKKIDDTKTRIHERYNSTDRSNNIALLRLKTKITLHSEDPVISIIAPVCLPWPDSYFGADLSMYLKEGEDVDKKETINITLQTVDELHNTTGRAHILISIDVNSYL